MSLYPTLEDMKVDQMSQVQQKYEQAFSAQQQAIQYQQPPQYPGQPGAAAAGPAGSALYPSLDEYMGLSIDTVAHNMQLVPVAQEVQVVGQSTSQNMMVAPVTGNNLGLRRAEVKQGIRECVLCKDGDGKMGLRVRAVNRGVFVAFVHVNSPAALAGLRFGDQILQMNNQTVAGWDTDKCMKFLKNAPAERITFAIRDRPFERTVTMQKDSVGHIGFVFKEGQIRQLVKDSSAARNGLLTEHHLLEVNGQNVVGMKDSEISEIINSGGRTITVTVIPSVIYEQIVKCIGSSLIKKFMDHSIPDV